MGLHLLALAKLHWQLTSHGLRPAMAGIICPLVLKFLMGFRLCRDEALYQSRLFLFRLGHIAFNRETPLSTAARMELALRLIWGTLSANASSSSSSSPAASSTEDSDIGQDTFHSLSMIAL